MFTLANKLATPVGLIGQSARRVFKGSRVMYHQGSWPEAITQQDLKTFLEDIDYFEEKKNLQNIGLKACQQNKDVPRVALAKQTIDSEKLISPEIEFDDLLEALGKEAPLSALDIDDTIICPAQLTDLALSHGIYRDLFNCHNTHKSKHISFTPEQATRLDRLVPHYWITDLPYSRVQRHKKDPDLIQYFNPLISISAQFINESEDPQRDHYAHTAYHGNIIPASGAIVKPAISIDGRWLNSDPFDQKLEKPSTFRNWKSATITCHNFNGEAIKHYYSIVMLNLDSLYPDKLILHWFLANISSSDSNNAGSAHDELCEYLPVHGIQGFGYSRYVFLCLQHDVKLNQSDINVEDFSLQSRMFDTTDFLDRNEDKNIIPVGLSWFQTSWDVSSNKIFHDYLKMKSPIYEIIQPVYEKHDKHNSAYPGKIPFNIFLDHCRSKKEINQQVLLERLKSIDPYDYKDQYVPPKVPPTVFDDEPRFSWMRNISFKKNLKVGYWRGLRPASVTLPLNNNADLDDPVRPKRHPDDSQDKLRIVSRLIYSENVIRKPNAGK